MIKKNFFNPKSIAVVGASRKKTKLGFTILKNILDYNYKGKVYPVNPKTKKILGRVCYANISQIPIKIDLAILVIPAKIAPIILEECGRKKVPNVIIISAGFKEIGGEGIVLEKKICEITKKYKINLLGPNCLGILDSVNNLNASFAEGMIEKGKVAFMSQSGAICTAMLDWAHLNDIGFSRFISLGNKAGITEIDLMKFFARDKETKVVLAYLEEISYGQEFLRVAKKLTKKKPLIIVKAGKTREGQAAISSHTGSLAGRDEGVVAAFRQTNTIRANSLGDLFNLIKVFNKGIILRNNRIGIVANAGGPSVMTTDAISESSLRLAKFTSKTIRKLRENLPITANIYNPVDVVGDAMADRYELAMETVLKDKNVDALIVLLTPQTVTEIEKTARAIINNSKKFNKKLIVSSFIGGKKVKPGIELLQKNNIAHFEFPEETVETLNMLYRYCKDRSKKEIFPQVKLLRSQKDFIKGIVAKNIRRRFKQIDFLESLKILKYYGIMTAEYYLVTSKQEVKKSSQKLGYPVAMKIISNNIIHKTEVGGVEINIKNDKEAVSAYESIISNVKKEYPKAMINGVLIQPMIREGKEIIIGMKRDPQFGPLIMFGLGGIYVEVLKDVSFRVAPVAKEQAREIISEIKSFKLLRGIRGEKASDINSLVDLITKVSQLSLDIPEIKELDINPAFVLSKGQGYKVVDVRFII